MKSLSKLDKAVALSKPQPLGKDPKPTVIQKALAQFEDTCGGRDGLVKVLLNYSHQSDDGDLIMNLLADPRNVNEPLSQLCARAGLSVGRFLKIFSSAKGSKAYIDAMDRVWPQLPEVASELMQSARVFQGKCPSCDGAGERRMNGANRKPKPCQLCNGKGTIEQQPDLERQKVALQLGGLLKGAPASQTIIDNSRQTQINMPVSMKSFISATNRILYGPSTAPSEQVVEAESRVLEEEPNAG